MKKTVILILLCALQGLLFSSCEKYEKLPQNDSFVVAAKVSNGSAVDGVPLSIVVKDGTVQGASVLGLEIVNTADMSTPSFSVLLNGRTVLEKGAEWSFSDEGVASFVVKGLSAGDYHAVATVSRWYHSASVMFDFSVY